jgi:hypothetical protein
MKQGSSVLRASQIKKEKKEAKIGKIINIIKKKEDGKK